MQDGPSKRKAWLKGGRLTEMVRPGISDYSGGETASRLLGVGFPGAGATVGRWR